MAQEGAGAGEAVDERVAVQMQDIFGSGDVAIASEEGVKRFNQDVARAAISAEGRQRALDELRELAAVAQGKQQLVDAEIGGPGDMAGAEHDAPETGGITCLRGGAM